MEAKLSKEVYRFEKKFEYLDGQLDNIDEIIDIEIDLTVDLIENRFWLDLNSPFNVETGILLVYGQNLVGNTRRKTLATAEFYKWVGDICEFAYDKLNKKAYNIYEDKDVIELAVKFVIYVDKYRKNNPDSSSSFEEIFPNFESDMNRKVKSGKKKTY